MSVSYKLESKYGIVVGHLGLGDHIICNSLYRILARRYKRLFVLVKYQNRDSMKRMLSDVHNITIILLPESISSAFSIWLARIKVENSRLLNIIKIGSYGKDFLKSDNIKFDLNFYQQVNIDFNRRWEDFKIIRNDANEKRLYNKIVGNHKNFIFLHEDSTRDFLIDRTLIKSNLPIIQPTNDKKFNFFDYLYIIERASEIHCIESSFCALIESLSIETKKYAHRYARPEANLWKNQEFSYRTEWVIVNKQ